MRHSVFGLALVITSLAACTAAEEETSGSAEGAYSSGACDAQRTCADCTDKFGCGWCDGRCVAGDSFQPASGDGCYAYASVPSMCEAPQQTPPGTLCSRQSTCAACTEMLGCGWCGGSCVAAGREGPTSGAACHAFAYTAASCDAPGPVGPAPTKPPTPPRPSTTGADLDVFDDSAFGGAPLTAAEAAALFAPGSARAALGDFRLAQRTRACNRVTGCGPWTASASVVLTGPNVPDTGGWYSTPQSSKVPSGQVSGKTWLAVKGSKVGLSLASDVESLYAEQCALDGQGSCTLETKTVTCYWRADGTLNCYESPDYVMSELGRSAVSLRFRVDAEHVRGRSTKPIQSAEDGTGTYREREYALYARTAGGSATLVEDGGRVFVRF